MVECCKSDWTTNIWQTDFVFHWHNNARYVRPALFGLCHSLTDSSLFVVSTVVLFSLGCVTFFRDLFWSSLYNAIVVIVPPLSLLCLLLSTKFKRFFVISANFFLLLSNPIEYGELYYVNFKYMYTCISIIICFFIVVTVVSRRFLSAILVSSSCEKNVECINQMTNEYTITIILLDMLISLVSLVSNPHLGQGTGWPRSYLKPLRLTWSSQ